jgi:hypothetical protein
MEIEDQPAGRGESTLLKNRILKTINELGKR